MTERKKVLIVDDSRTALMMSEMILKDGPFKILTASDGAQAVDVAVSEQPDLILMDVCMPNKDGFEALKEIRSREETQAIPVIMVTTRGEAENIELGYETGCNDYVTKPVNGQELVSKINNLIDG
jgi:DNA-binding response OmpR family regulator